MTFVGLVLALRAKLLDAIQSGDQETIARLLTTFGVLVDTSYAYEDQSITALFVSLEDAARNAAMRVEWKAPVPSAAAIQDALTKS